MNSVIARANIRFYRDILLSDLGPEERSRVHKLLIEEEDKLGKDLQLLSDIEGHIAETARRIEAQQLLVRAMQANGHDGGQAQLLLDGLMESRQLSMEYRQRVKEEIERSRL
jgi:hypothetical protein